MVRAKHIRAKHVRAKHVRAKLVRTKHVRTKHVARKIAQCNTALKVSFFSLLELVELNRLGCFFMDIYLR